MNKNLKHILAAASGLVCLIIYVITLNPTVTFLDCGELATVCYTFGVPHPTGYPLYLVLGFIWALLPLPFTVIYKLNLLSAVLGSAAVVISFYSINLILNNLGFTQSKIKKKSDAKGQKNQIESKDIVFLLISFFTAILTGLNRTYWFESTQTEVYALHSLFISILFYYCVKIYFNLKELKQSGKNNKNWALLIFFFGLSCANHSTTIYFIPGIIYLFYLQYKQDKLFYKTLIKSLLLLVPGAVLYSILIINAYREPFVNWSNPQDFNRFVELIRGSDFSHLMIQSSTTFFANFVEFLKESYKELAIVSGIFGLIGIIELWKINKQLFIFTIISIFTCLVISFNYSTLEIQTFYYLTYYLITVWSALGFLSLLRYIGSKNAARKVIAIGAIFCLISIAFNFKENNGSGNYANEEVTVNTLNQLEPNALLITYDYSFLYTASLYFQQVEKIRQDVKVFNIKFLSVPWYIDRMRKYYPDVYENVKTESEEYVEAYNKNDASIAPKLKALAKAFIDKNRVKFPVYLTVDCILSSDFKQFISSYNLQPDGLVYRLNQQNKYIENAGVKSLDVSFHKIEPIGFYRNRLSVVIPGLYYENAYYHYVNKNP
ncbi:MAG TPA: DUF2723 domain-containing protein, partial [Ignavibacteria bacterium]